jgi:hypothetical protein
VKRRQDRFSAHTEKTRGRFRRCTAQTEIKEGYTIKMKKNSLIFILGSCAYPTLEVLWRGYTHSSMALAGGVCMVLINRICCERMEKKSLAAKCAAGSLIITGVEFVLGIVVNRILHLHVWDYSSMPMNILGQICIPFSAIWFFLTIPATALCKLCGKAADHIFLPGKRNAAKRVTAP